jgi:hypothetical protein
LGLELKNKILILNRLNKLNTLVIFFLLISTISYASFPVINNEVVVESVTAPNRIDTFDIIGWIALGCLVLGGVLMALQSILAPGAYIGGYILLGMMVGGVGALLGLIWLFSRFKWGRKYWWALLLGLFLIQIISEQGHA